MAVNSKKQSELVIKLLALVAGIFVGCFYASFGRSVAKHWFPTKQLMRVETTTGAPIKSKPNISEAEQFLVSDNTEIADILAKKIKILCWIHQNNLDVELIDAIKKTWGRRCTGFISITNFGQNLTDVYNIPNDENASSNTDNAYRFIFSEFGEQYDWFLKTNGSSYVVMENLRYKLFAYQPEDGIGVGLVKNNSRNDMYLSDKAGYALSKKALNLLVDGIDNNKNCSLSIIELNDEERIGYCLKAMGVRFAKSTDEHDKELFYEQDLDHFLLPNENVKLPSPWYQEYKVDHNLDKASNYSISFCEMDWKRMHVMEFLIYQLRPYGIETETPLLPENVIFKNFTYWTQ